MSDKKKCHKLYREAGLPVPLRIRAKCLDTLFSKMKAKKVERVFIKPRHGSSASGIVALWLDPKDKSGQPHIITPIVIASDGYFNSLRLRHYTDKETIEQILHWSFAEGAHVEEWLERIRCSSGCYWRQGSSNGSSS